MTMIRDGQWYTQRTVSGYAIQWRVAPGKFVTCSVDQWGRIRSTSYPSEIVCVSVSEMHQRLKTVIDDVRAPLRETTRRFGTRSSTQREDLCDRIVAELNVRGVKPVGNWQRPEASK